MVNLFVLRFSFLLFVLFLIVSSKATDCLEILFRNSGGSRTWQGRVSNPSERGTGGGEAPDMRAEGGHRRGSGGLRQKI